MRAAVLLLGGGLSLLACSPDGPPVESDAEAMTLQERRVETAGVPVAVLDSGPGERGPAFLLLHGAAFTKEDWVETGIAPRLAEAGYRVVAVDLPGGRGATPAGGGEPAEFLLALMDSLGLEQPIVVTPSASGRYALPALVRAPGRFAGLVAAAPVTIPQHKEALATCPVPILGIWGSRDRIVPVAQGRVLADTVPNGRLVVLEGASHPSWLNEPGRFGELLLEFAASLGTADEGGEAGGEAALESGGSGETGGGDEDAAGSGAD